MIKCNRCNRNYIDEEYKVHECAELQIEVFDTEGNRWGSYDKLTFFRLPPFPPTNLNNQNKQPDNEQSRQMVLFAPN